MLPRLLLFLCCLLAATRSNAASVRATQRIRGGSSEQGFFKAKINTALSLLAKKKLEGANLVKTQAEANLKEAQETVKKAKATVVQASTDMVESAKQALAGAQEHLSDAQKEQKQDVAEVENLEKKVAQVASEHRPDNCMSANILCPASCVPSIPCKNENDEAAC